MLPPKQNLNVGRGVLDTPKKASIWEGEKQRSCNDIHFAVITYAVGDYIHGDAVIVSSTTANKVSNITCREANITAVRQYN